MLKINDIDKKNIQILVETMTRCAGNCSGCALSSIERMNTLFDFDNFLLKSQLVLEQLNQINAKYTDDDIESISIFLGQGDHFLMKDSDIPSFMKICAEMIPDNLKAKTVLFITASAIGKHEVIKEKMDLFYQLSLSYNLPFFIQTVFDPKKMKITKKFQDIYIKNILYFKEKCGMTEVTINMGEDLFIMSPSEFHEWIKLYGFRHIEMNWVNNVNTHHMWKKNYQEMFTWLQDWLTIYVDDFEKHSKSHYEINFLPFMFRHFKNKDINLISMKDKITRTFEDNIYIDYNGKISPSQMGLISNLTPFVERLSTKTFTATQATAKTISTLARRDSCNNCHYQSVCSVSGISTWFVYADNNIEDCPWNIKDFLTFLEEIEHRLSIINQNKKNTIFDKNPVQNIDLIQNNNATFTYFENQT